MSAGAILAAVPERLRPEFFGDEARTELDRLATDAGGEVRWATSLLETAEDPGGADDLARARILLASWGLPPLGAALLDRLPALELVAYTGASVRPFVTDELYARGIRVTQSGEGMARSVAEVALTFTLALLHRVHVFDHALRDGLPWDEAEDSDPRHEILSQPVGIVGASRTGRANIALLRALGARVSVYDPYLTDEEARTLGVRRRGLDAVLSGSAVVVLHAPSLPETRHLIGARELALMADGAGLVNTARSWLVEEPALLAELATGRLHAALDVFDEEPLPVGHPLRTLPNVLLTPHKAAGTVECRRRQGEIAVAEIARHLAGEPLRHAVSVTDLERMA